jgi:hypothetical protein
MLDSFGQRHSISPRTRDGTSGSSHCFAQRLPQRNVAEWLQKYVHRSLFEHPLMDRLVSLTGNEDDRNLVAATLELLLQIKTTHTWHSDIQYQTHGSVNAVGYKEFIGRRKSKSRKTEFLQQVRERLANGYVVINHDYYQTFWDVFCSRQATPLECG